MTHHCPSCGGPGSPDRRFGEPFLSCLACGLRFSAVAPEGAVYGAAYYRRGGGLPKPVVGLLHRLAYGPALRLAKPGARVLEIGCGSGVFVELLGARGCEVHAMDASPEALRLAAERSPRAVFHEGVLEAQRFPAAHFDVIWSFHVLEHVEDPSAFLAEARRILKPGGVLLLRVPNAGSLEAALSGTHWFHFDWPFHLAHWSPRSLRAALARAGFSRAASHPALDYPQALLYAALSALGLRRLTMPVKLALLPLQALFMPLSVALGWIGKSGTMEFRARV